MDRNIRQCSAKIEHDFGDLRKMVRECKFMMAKSERPVYGDELTMTLQKASMWFILSYQAKDADVKYNAALKCDAWFAVFREDLRQCIEDNIIKFPHRAVKFGPNGLPIGNPNTERVNSRKLALVDIVAKIDIGIGRWCNSLSQGRSVADAPEGKAAAADKL